MAADDSTSIKWLTETSFRLRDKLSLRMDDRGVISVWSPTVGQYRRITSEEIVLLGLLAPGASARQAMAAGAFDADDEQLAVVLRGFLETGLLEVERAAMAQSQGSSAQAGDRPIFIVGCPRSGTTLVRWIVDTHSRIHCPGETRILLPLRDLYNRHLLQGTFPQLQIDSVEVRSRLRQFYAGFMEGLAARAGKGRWADKTPHYSLIPEFIYELFERSCQFVIVVRHGLDVADSFATVRREKRASALGTFDALIAGDDNLDMPIVSGARIWARFNEHLRRFLKAHPDACTVVRYESLISEPERTCDGLFDFLGERMEAGLLDRVFHVDHGPGAQDASISRTKRIDPSRAGRWRTWPRSVVESVADLVNPELEAWGFERV